MTKPSTCPTPHKRSYPSKNHARNALHKTWRTGYRGGQHKLPLRIYHCPCGKWHLTSKEWKGATLRHCKVAASA